MVFTQVGCDRTLKRPSNRWAPANASNIAIKIEYRASRMEPVEHA
jgi:hypothetical protein